MSETAGSPDQNAWYVGSDVGGTFTDVIAWRAGERPRIVKVPTSPDNQASALLEGVQAAVPEPGWSSIAEVVHGTTVGTNAILERRGADTAIVTNEGFRDILEMGRRTRPSVYGLRGTFVPHVPRWWRFEIAGRLDRDGREVTPVDEAQVRKVAAAIRREGVVAVAVVLLHSYANRAHEDAVARVLEEELPGVSVSKSADILAEIGEFERTAATALNAYVEPMLTRYLNQLVTDLRPVAPRARVRVMQGNGGTTPADGPRTGFPIRSVMSGPAAGMTGACRVLAELGIGNAITCDMGGTSFDVGVVEGGHPVVTNEIELEFNVPIKIPTLDIRTIGAGGGSIAYLDDGGMLRVGPQSAGAVPGPIWYGRGGTRLTVTDANVLAGRLKAVTLGTGMRPALTPEQIWETVCASQPELVEAFGTPEALSEAVIRVIVATMAACVRDLTVRRGRDPRDYAIVAYGGAGALHAVEIAQELGAAQVIVPSFPGLLCAYGSLVADYTLDGTVTIRCPLDRLDAAGVQARIAPLVDRLDRELQGFEGMTPTHRVLYECQFERQSHGLHIEAPLGVSAADLRHRFLAEYTLRYGDLLPNSPVIVRSVRVESRCARRGADRWSLRDATAPAGIIPPAGVKYWRPALTEGDLIDGPATVSAVDASIVLPPKSRARVASAGHIVVEVAS